MKRLAPLIFIIATLGGPIQAQAQQYPVLTQQAADFALGLIKFEAAAVTGADPIGVTHDTLQIWRSHLANAYPALSPNYQLEFGPLACLKLDMLNRVFSQLSMVEREQLRREWAASLPAVLQLLEPVVEAELQQLLAHPNARSVTHDVDPVTELQRRQIDMTGQANFMTNMTNSTIGQMRAMSGR